MVGGKRKNAETFNLINSEIYKVNREYLGWYSSWRSLQNQLDTYIQLSY